MQKSKLRGNETGTEKGGGQNSLSIDEFMYAMVMIACHKYHMEGTVQDMAGAVTRLIQTDLLAKVDPAAFNPPDDFRGALLYRQDVDEVLRVHEPSLRMIFGACMRCRDGTQLPCDPALTYTDDIEIDVRGRCSAGEARAGKEAPHL
jgi:hypothetical protein